MFASTVGAGLSHYLQSMVFLSSSHFILLTSVQMAKKICHGECVSTLILDSSLVFSAERLCLSMLVPMKAFLLQLFIMWISCATVSTTHCSPWMHTPKYIFARGWGERMTRCLPRLSPSNATPCNPLQKEPVDVTGYFLLFKRNILLPRSQWHSLEKKKKRRPHAWSGVSQWNPAWLACLLKLREERRIMTDTMIHIS